MVTNTNVKAAIPNWNNLMTRVTQWHMLGVPSVSLKVNILSTRLSFGKFQSPDPTGLFSIILEIPALLRGSREWCPLLGRMPGGWPIVKPGLLGPAPGESFVPGKPRGFPSYLPSGGEVSPVVLIFSYNVSAGICKVGGHLGLLD